MVSGTLKYEMMMERKQTVAENKNDPPIPSNSSITGNSLMERKSVMDLMTDVMEDAAPRTDTGNSSENRIHVTGPRPRA